MRKVTKKKHKIVEKNKFIKKLGTNIDETSWIYLKNNLYIKNKPKSIA